MKKSVWLAGLLAVSLVFSLISCSNSSGGSSGSGGGTGGNGGTVTNYKAGDVALAKIKIGTTEYDNTTEVYVTGPNGATIRGKTNTDNYAGVFVEGRTVILSPFIMSKYEVTQDLYKAVMTGNSDGVIAEPFVCKADNDSYKVLLTGEEQKYRAAEGMTWYDAVYFCNALSDKTGLTKAYTISGITKDTDGYITSATVELVANANGYRLPTEAEWEFAARGGDPSKDAWDYLFSGAATAQNVAYSESKNTGLDSVGWYNFNTKNGTTGDESSSSGEAGYGTHHVGKKTANALGIFDMSGNVREWCYDWYDSSATAGDNGNASVTNPTGPSSLASKRIRRGGSWGNYANSCSVCDRNSLSPDGKGNGLGFRIVRSVQ